MIVLDNQQWVEQQFADCDFNHNRRSDRMKIVAKNMLALPDGSLPQQNESWSDLKQSGCDFVIRGSREHRNVM
ncbi:MAG: transposase DNA-binding-containing protein, partial [Rubripirellula sp.]